MDCSFVPTVSTEPSNNHGKTFADRHKTAKFAKVFSLESFPLYRISMGIYCSYMPSSTLESIYKPLEIYIYSMASNYPVKNV